VEDLNTRIQRLSDLDRGPLIDALIRIDAEMRDRPRVGDRARLGSAERTRADDARSESDRLGRIIYFLRFQSPAFGATPEDLALCDLLAEKLKAKGQWEGECHPEWRS
jgi:hypothetical protein